MKIGFIDHYDSFSFNVIDWLCGEDEGLELVHVYCDDGDGMAGLLQGEMPVVLSPGPKSPRDVPLSCEVVRAILGKVPILGVCLGHQILAYVLGGEIVQCRRPEHGVVQKINVIGHHPVFEGLIHPVEMAVYNSLCVALRNLGKSVKVLAVNEFDEIQALSYVLGSYEAIGLQFHPESFLSCDGRKIARNWLRYCRWSTNISTKATQQPQAARSDQ